MQLQYMNNIQECRNIKSSALF